MSHDHILIFSDIDECSEENFTCHPNATCINTQGSYNCQCKDGFEGDGKKNCTGGKLFIKQNVYLSPLTLSQQAISFTTSDILIELFYNVNISARIHPPLKQITPLKS